MSQEIEHASSDAAWWLYIVECSDGSLYTGITTDLHRRLSEHNGKTRGAKYTRSRQPVRLVYTTPCTDRSSASKLEARTKRLTRKEKLALIGGTKCHV